MDIQQQILDSFHHGIPLTITGGHSKSFLGPVSSATQAISTTSMSGIVSYQPDELVMTAQAGTPLAEIESTLNQVGQQFPFDPPAFSDQATLGGTIACGLSGPGRPWQGAARDFVLGTRLINGKGELLRFGGEVIKNVAGYDVSRLMCGAFGTLGLLTELSIKVVPLADSVLTLSWQLDQEAALQKIVSISQRPYPISAAIWFAGQLSIRFSGATAATQATHRALGGEPVDNCLWKQVREQKLDFFNTDKPLWRLSLPQATPVLELQGDLLIDWGGAQRWLISEAESLLIRQITEAAGGHATLFRSPHQNNTDQFTPLTTPMLGLHQRIKRAFDPKGIFNPGRLYREL